ncbi:Hypothetical protein GLP15_3890 [Giardia lamblia P15]|uniref:Proteasome assembly chaperone 3 n=1 Tax=Giardia intestinalis (strain P15) TaxID=658858 RepID=E1F0L5_GIAIA|nr:Hypothetical protein GLP15_3890 [Giardia lamblia P15]
MIVPPTIGLDHDVTKQKVGVTITKTPVGELYIQQHIDSALVTISETGKISHVIRVVSVGSQPETTILFGNRCETDLRLLAREFWRKLNCEVILCIGVQKRTYPELKKALNL